GCPGGSLGYRSYTRRSTPPCRSCWTLSGMGGYEPGRRRDAGVQPVLLYDIKFSCIFGGGTFRDSQGGYAMGTCMSIRHTLEGRQGLGYREWRLRRACRQNLLLSRQGR